MEEKRYYCVPCAEKLRQVRTVEDMKMGTKKETCAECGKRRYCRVYRVTK